MSTKTRLPVHKGLAALRVQVPAAPSALPWTTLEHLHHIAALGRRIQSYVQFMAEVAAFQGASSEIKERAVADFHRQIAAMEGNLGKIHEELQLG